jgi:UDP-N-acetylglucosamine 1-carboxyvinyltransferase
VALPGGDDLGACPIEWHLEGLEQMGAEFELVHGELVGSLRAGSGNRSRVATFRRSHREPPCGSSGRGATVIVNAAREPEIRRPDPNLTAMGRGSTVEGRRSSPWRASIG